jgi:hypothetical protein
MGRENVLRKWQELAEVYGTNAKVKEKLMALIWVVQGGRKCNSTYTEHILGTSGDNGLNAAMSASCILNL